MRICIRNFVVLTVNRGTQSSQFLTGTPGRRQRESFFSTSETPHKLEMLSSLILHAGSPYVCQRHAGRKRTAVSWVGVVKTYS